jgi:probable rRNA maturation factor
LTPPDLSDVPAKLRHPVAAALQAAGIEDGHLGMEIVGEGRMRTLNYAHRGVDEATDVLAFPLDGADRPAGPRELGDVFICPARASDVNEAAVHGTLHLCGYDHETDKGEMLALQAEVMASVRGGPAGEAEGPPVS